MQFLLVQRLEVAQATFQRRRRMEKDSAGQAAEGRTKCCDLKFTCGRIKATGPNLIRMNGADVVSFTKTIDAQLFVL